jgi:hypothetical protein
MDNSLMTYLCADCGQSGSIDLSGKGVVIVSACKCVEETNEPS